METGLKAYIFGFTLAMSIGPIAMIIINNAIRNGRTIALKNSMGAACGDFTFALLAFSVGVSILSSLEEFRFYIEKGSALILLLFGLWMLVGAVRSANQELNSQNNFLPGFKATYFLTIMNPLSIVAFMAYSNNLLKTGSFAEIILIAFCIFAGSLSAQTIYALGASSFRRLFTNTAIPTYINLLSSLVVIGFGINFLFN